MDEELLALETRRRLYDVVRDRPGIAARELQRVARTGWGETVYHLDRLCGSGLLHREPGEHQDHYFVAVVPLGDRRLLRFLRSPSARRLLLAILETPGATVPELAERTRMSVGRIAVHLRRMLATGTVVSGRRGRFRTYALADRDQAFRLLVTYRAGYADRWVESLLETWGELFRP